MEKNKVKGIERRKFITTKKLMVRWDTDLYELYSLYKKRLIKPLMTPILSTFTSPSMSDIRNGHFGLAEIEEFEKSNPNFKPIDTPYISSSGEIPPYLEKGHKLYREELDIAIDALMNLYNSDFEFNTKEGHGVQIKTWIKNKYPNSTNSMRERIATIINNRGPGTPKISE